MGNQGNEALFEISACCSPPISCAEWSALKIREDKVRYLRQTKASGRGSVVLCGSRTRWGWMVTAGGIIASQVVKEAASANPETKIEIARFLAKVVPLCSVFAL